jgi:acyl-CoA reductase-like NAD-dependent aldehyde dehydrogenase
MGVPPTEPPERQEFPMDMIINGQRTTAKETFDVLNPATLDVVDSAPRSGEAELEQAINAAKAALPLWRQDLSARRAAVEKCTVLIRENLQDIAQTLVQEQGKPLAEATTEVVLASVFFQYFAGLDFEQKILKEDDANVVKLLRKPLGIVATITPWNFPLAILSWKLAPALLVGNTVISKPASTTPLSTLKLIEVLNQALPPGVLNSLSGPGSIGAAMAKHPDIRKISFTGSVEVGRSVMRDASDTVKRLTLELGGNDPAIVLDDADVDAVAPAIFGSAFMNAGQICIAVKRVYAHETIYPKLVSKFAELAKGIKVGNGLEDGTQMGPVNNRPQLELVQSLVEDARKRGGKIEAGGEGIPGTKGYFFQPTIVSGLDDSARLVAEEQFGPALPILPYRDVSDALERANATIFGLGASVWSNDVDRATAVAAELEAGTTWVNQHLKLEPDVPFGGLKQSGMGRELGMWGLEEFCDLQVLSVKKK